MVKVGEHITLDILGIQPKNIAQSFYGEINL